MCNLLAEWMVEQLDIGFVLDMLDIEFLGRTCSTCSTCSTLSFMAATSCFDPACANGAPSSVLALSACRPAHVLQPWQPCCSRGNLVAAFADLLQQLQACCNGCRVSLLPPLAHCVFVCMCVCVRVCACVCMGGCMCVCLCVGPGINVLHHVHVHPRAITIRQCEKRVRQRRGYDICWRWVQRVATQQGRVRQERCARAGGIRGVWIVQGRHHKLHPTTPSPPVCPPS